MSHRIHIRPVVSRFVRGLLSTRRTCPCQARLRVEVLESRNLLDVSLTVGANVLVHPKEGTQNETSISMNPTNPTNVFAISNDSRSNDLFANYSTNGGQTWQLTDVSQVPQSCCDQQTAWDSFGNLFMAYLTSTSPRGVVTVLSTDGGQTFRLLDRTDGTNGDQPSVAVGPSGAGDGSGSVWISWRNRVGSIIA